MRTRSRAALVLTAAALVVACAGSDDEATTPPSPTAMIAATSTATASASPTPDVRVTPPPDESAPTIAPDGRTQDAELNALIEDLLTDDATALEQRVGDVEARERDKDANEDHVWTAKEWASRFAGSGRSLYAVTLGDPQASPDRDFDVVVAATQDGQREGWRFAVGGDEIVEVVILDQPSTVSVTGAYDRFLVLPPIEELPHPPAGYSFDLDIPGTGDGGVDGLVDLLAARDESGLQAAVAYDGGELPVQQCGGDREPRDSAYVDRWLAALTTEAYSLRAIANVPEGYVPVAEHLVVVVRETAPYDWEEAGLLEADGHIVGLLTGCVRYPPRAFVVAPPLGGTGELDADRRSGVEVLDAVLDALAAKDRAQLLSLTDFGEIGCVTDAIGIGSPPTCGAGEREGDLVEVLPTAGCEGAYTRRDEVAGVIDNLVGTDWLLYAAVDRGQPAGPSPFTRGQIAAVLAPANAEDGRGANVLTITDRGIASRLAGCGPESPEEQLAKLGMRIDSAYAPDLLLAPPAAHSALWLIEVATGRRTVLYEGAGQGTARFDPGGQTVSALLHFPDDRYRSARYDLDGRALEEYEDRGRITASPDGDSRFYRVQDPAPAVYAFVLEHDGKPVPVGDVDAGTYGVAFSPDGSRLLISSGAAGSDPSIVVFTHRVIDVASGATLLTFDTRAPEGTDGGEEPSWSPSGRYVASRDFSKGLFVHDTQTGESTQLGTGLSRWSPADDAILAVDEDGNLELVRFPGAVRTRVATSVGDAQYPRLGATGRYAYWEDGPQRSSTTIVDTTSGDVVATIDTPSRDAIYPGVHTVTATARGMAAALPVVGDECRGTLLIHPALADGSRCLDGGYVARWSPDGTLLAYANGDELRVLDPANGRERVLARGLDPADYAEGALARWSADGAYLLVQWPSGGLGWSEE